MIEEINYEQLSYGKSVYKRVQRLRRKGQRRGIAVPYLGYELHKPEKPRIAFWIVAAVSAVLFIGIIIGVGFIFNELVKTSSSFSDLGDVLQAVFDPEVFKASAGLSVIPGLLIIAAYILLFFVLLLPVLAIIYACNFIREAVYMAKCSKEEFAKGNVISSRIIRLVVALACATAIFIALFIVLEEVSAWVWGVYFGIVIALGGLLALIVFEKAKCKKWFDSLEEDKKQNYLAHDGALRRVKSRLNREKQFISNLGR